MAKSKTYFASQLREILNMLDVVQDAPKKIVKHGMLYPERFTLCDEGDSRVAELIYDWEMEDWLVKISDDMVFEP